MEEEDAFWMLCTVIEDLLPASYFSSTLIGVQVSPASSLSLCCLSFLRFFRGDVNAEAGITVHSQR